MQKDQGVQFEDYGEWESVDGPSLSVKVLGSQGSNEEIKGYLEQILSEVKSLCEKVDALRADPMAFRGAFGDEFKALENNAEMAGYAPLFLHGVGDGQEDVGLSGFNLPTFAEQENDMGGEHLADVEIDIPNDSMTAEEPLHLLMQIDEAIRLEPKASMIFGAEPSVVELEEMLADQNVDINPVGLNDWNVSSLLSPPVSDEPIVLGLGADSTIHEELNLEEVIDETASAEFVDEEPTSHEFDADEESSEELNLEEVIDETASAEFVDEEPTSHEFDADEMANGELSLDEVAVAEFVLDEELNLEEVIDETESAEFVEEEPMSHEFDADEMANGELSLNEVAVAEFVLDEELNLDEVIDETASAEFVDEEPTSHEFDADEMANGELSLNEVAVAEFVLDEELNLDEVIDETASAEFVDEEPTSHEFDADEMANGELSLDEVAVAEFVLDEELNLDEVIDETASAEFVDEEPTSHDETKEDPELDPLSEGELESILTDPFALDDMPQTSEPEPIVVVEEALMPEALEDESEPMVIDEETLAGPTLQHFESESELDSLSEGDLESILADPFALDDVPHTSEPEPIVLEEEALMPDALESESEPMVIDEETLAGPTLQHFESESELDSLSEGDLESILADPFALDDVPAGQKSESMGLVDDVLDIAIENGLIDEEFKLTNIETSLQMSETLCEQVDDAFDQPLGAGIEDSATVFYGDTRFMDQEILNDGGDMDKNKTTNVSMNNGAMQAEMRAMMAYFDDFLKDLPEEKIEEFADSAAFKLYKKLYQDLGVKK